MRKMEKGQYLEIVNKKMGLRRKFKNDKKKKLRQ